MTSPLLQTQIDSAHAYEALFVPALFAYWPPVVADTAQVVPGMHVLDIACGTGVLARTMLRRVTPGGSVAGVDANPGMLEVAKHVTPDIEWKEATAESLPFADDAFDAVVSQFGLMFFTDREQAVREMRRVLKHSGRAAVAVWADLESNPAYAREVELLDQRAGRAAGDAVRAPFALGDPRALHALFADAGFDSVDVAVHTGAAEFPSIRTMVEAELRGWLPVMGVELTEDKIGEILDEAEHSLGDYITPKGTAAFPTRANIVSAVKGT